MHTYMHACIHAYIQTKKCLHSYIITNIYTSTFIYTSHDLHTHVPQSPRVAPQELSVVLCVSHGLYIYTFVSHRLHIYIYIIYLTFFIHIPQTDSCASTISAHGEISAELSAPRPVSMETWCGAENSADISVRAMGWLQLVDSLKLQVSFAKEPYKRDYILHKKPII